MLIVLVLFSSIIAFPSNLLVQQALAQTTVDSIPTSLSSTYEIVINPNTNMIYATALGSTSVLVISGDSSSQVATISLSRSVNDIAVNPTTNLIYLTTASSNSVIVIDGNANNAISEISLQHYALSIAVNPVTNMLYVSHGNSQAYSNLISVIDGDTNSVVSSIQLDSSSYGDLDVNENTNMVYLAGHFSNSLSVIDGGNNTVVATVPVGYHPSKVAVNSVTNRIYVANYVEDTLSVVDGETNSVIATVEVGGYHPYTSLSNPSAVDVDTNSNIIYVVNQYADCVNIIDGETNEVKDTLYIYGTQSVEYTNPVGVVINPNTGKAYVTNNSNTSGFISVIDYDESSPGSDAATLIVNTIDADTHNTIRGYYTTLSKDGSLQNWLYTPASFLLNDGETYSVSVYDYGDYVFDHWEDGSITREREISITADTSITLPHLEIPIRLLMRNPRQLLSL
jgi:YVTN family beta-propeller protein